MPKEVTETINPNKIFPGFTLEGDIDDVINSLVYLRNELWDQGFFNARLEIDSGYNNWTAGVEAIRWESKEERKARLRTAK